MLYKKTLFIKFFIDQSIQKALTEHNPVKLIVVFFYSW